MLLLCAGMFSCTQKQTAKTQLDPSKAMNSQEHERLGDVLLERDNLEMALFQYNRSFELDPGNISARYKRGVVHLRGGNNQDAINIFEDVLSADPEYALAYEGMGRAYFNTRNYDQGRLNLQKALQLDPELWRSRATLGMIYDRLGMHSQAIDEHLMAIDLNPREGSLYNNLGVSYNLNSEFDNAVEAFTKALSLNFQDATVYNNLGLALSKTGRYSAALEAFRKAGSEAQAYNNLGCVYLNQGRYEDAIKAFEKAIELDPSFYVTAGENLKRARLALGKQ